MVDQPAANGYDALHRPVGGSTTYTVVVSFVAAVGGLLFGFDTGVISGAIPFVTTEFSLDMIQQGFAVSNLMIACTVGALVAGPITDRWGRKRVLILAAMLFLVSALLSALPRSFTELVFARFIGGLAVGVASVLSPMYIAEISPAWIRGRLVALNQLAIVVGILVTYFSNWLLVDTGLNNWRYMFAAEGVPSAVFLRALFAIPESPRWLIKCGRIDEARAIFNRIGGADHAEAEIREVTATIKEEKGSVIDLFRPGLRRPMIIAILLALFAHITGIDTIIYYGPTIFLEAGFGEASNALLASVVIGMVNLIFTFVGIAMVDRIGRRLLLLIGFAGMTLSMLTFGYTFGKASIGGVLVLLPALTFIASFCLSVGVVIWVYTSEIFPTKIRGTAVSIATMVLWFSNVIIAQAFPWMMSVMGGGAFYTFGVLSGLAFLFVLLMLPETKGLTLEEIENMWTPGVAPAAVEMEP